MGQNSSTAHNLFSVDSYVSEVPNVSYETSMGSSRFLKSVRCTLAQPDDGSIVLKIFPKRDPQAQLSAYFAVLSQQKKLLVDIPNILPFEQAMETERAGYLLRQYLYSSLYDRISTRPFLSTVEKKWIVFQLLSACAEMHKRGVYHGDIKSENILVTSYSWAYYTDFAPFKPVYLPEDDPADYSYFFDSSNRRSCYLAPERFVSSTQLSGMKQELTYQMDIFALGCVIAELFLEGTSIFPFSDLLRYRQNEYSPMNLLQRIEDEGVKTLISHMIQLDPKARLPAAEYLTKFSTLFPSCFSSFLYEYMSSIVDYYEGDFADHVITRLFSDFDKLSTLLINIETEENNQQTQENFLEVFPVQSCLSEAIGQVGSEEGELGNIFLTLVCTCLLNVTRRELKLVALDMILTFGRSVNDVYKLDRCIPYLVQETHDADPIVRSMSIRILTDLLASVQHIPSSDADICSEYIFPQIHHLSTDDSVMVRMSFAASISSLAETALRFLETSEQSLISSIDSGANKIDTFDSRLSELRLLVEDQVLALLMDPSSEVKQSLLLDMSNLCLFFGRVKANELLLSHIITYLNDSDWRLRSCFFKVIVSIGTFLGRTSVDHYIIPLLTQGLYDQCESVIERVLLSMRSLAELTFFTNSRLRELITSVSPLLLHPQKFIRNSTILFIDSACKNLQQADIFCFVMPVIRTFLRHTISTITVESLHQASLQPIPMETFDLALDIASSLRNPKISDRRHNNFDHPEFLKQLSTNQVPAEDQTKLIQIISWIDKISWARHRQKMESTQNQNQEFQSPNLLNFINTPHTVFLYPPTVESPLALGDRKSHSRSGSAQNRPYSATASGDLMGKMNSHLSRIKSESHLIKHQRQESKSVTDFSSETTPTSPKSPIGTPGEIGKSRPSISTTVTHVTADPQSREDSVKSMLIIEAVPPRHVKLHHGVSIQSPDEAIQKLLKDKSKKAFPASIFDLGPKISNNSIKPRRSGVKTNQATSFSQWRPSSTLIANFTEHSAAITGICVSPDCLFFASCSEDGSVKVWDCSRLEKNVTNWSRLTYDRRQGENVRYKCMCMAENSHCLFVGSDDGRVEVLRVELNVPANSQGLVQYERLSLVQTFCLANENPVQIQHYRQGLLIASMIILSFLDVLSCLVVATDRNNVYVYDLNKHKTLVSFSLGFHLGIITCFAIDSLNKSWILLGTSKGVLSFVDLRFGLILRNWLHPSSLSIHRLVPFPNNLGSVRSRRVFCSAGDNELSVWEVEGQVCREVYCARPLEDKIGRIARKWKPLDPPDQSVSKFLDRTQTGIDYAPSVFNDIVFSPEANFILTAGSDKKTRYWDLQTIEKSFCIGKPDGLERLYSSQKVENLMFCHEKTLKSALKTTSSTHNMEQRERRGSSSSILPSKSQLSANAEVSYCFHMESITYLALLDFPYPMLVSAGRDGIIKVWK